MFEVSPLHQIIIAKLTPNFSSFQVGAEVVKDPAFLITRTLEDFVTWVDSSKIRQHVLEYNDMKDDYDMM